MKVLLLAASSVPSPDTWQTIAAIATSVGVIIALITLILYFVSNLRSEKLTRQGQAENRAISEATAARAEAAAALTENYTRRIVDALEGMATRGIPGVGAAAVAPHVKWSLAHHQGDSYILTNEGNAAAADVQVSAHESMPVLRVDGGQDLAPGEALTFIAAMSMTTTDGTITVAWDEEGDGSTPTHRQWKYPLPARPPRQSSSRR